MSYTTYEDFLKHTNVMEVVIAKMKEEGPRIFRINYPQREKYCRFLYENFMNPKLRNKVFRFGLTLKAMPNSFKEKFLKFPEPNEMAEIPNLSGSPDEQDTKSNSPRLEDKYKDDQPSTSKAFIHKLRKTTSTKENPKQKKCKQESKSKQKSSSSTKSSTKITNYFSSNSQNCKDHERQGSQAEEKVKKRKSSECKLNKEVEPQAKRSKESPIISNENENKSLKTKINPLNSESKSKSKISQNKLESNSKHVKKLDFDDPVSNFEKENTNSQKTKTKTQCKSEAEDLVPDDCDIISEYTIIDLSTQESIHDPQAENPNMGDENSFSPSKLTLPKRNRTEDYLVSSFASSKNNFDEVSLGNRTECTTRMSRNDIFIWRDQGIKSTEEHNYDSSEDGCFYELGKDVSVRFNLQLARDKPDKMKKYIKHLITRRKLNKCINLEPPVASGPLLRTKMLQAFSQMTFEDFKYLLNAQKYISHWTAQGKPLDEAEHIFKTYYTAERQNAWPDVHIDLNRLQKYLLSKGFKGSLLLQFIPPRYLSFDEVLEKTNIKEFISLSCSKPPESYTQLLSLCRGEYEKCCCQGVWTEGLKFNEEKEENTSSHDMSIELFSQSTDIDSQNVQINAMQNEGTTQLNEIHSTTSFTKKKKIHKCGPKSRMKQLSANDELENQMNLLLGTDEQPASKNVVSMEKIDTQELNRILLQSQLQESQNENRNLSVGLKDTEKGAITSPTNESDRNSKSVTVTQQLSNISSDIDEAVVKSSYNQNSDSVVKTPPSELIASRLDSPVVQPLKSPNLFQSSGESITKDIESQPIEVRTQESVYVACENNNDHNYTEQNNFSIRIIEASDSEDPFAEVVKEDNAIENASLIQATKSDETSDNSKLIQTGVILTAEKVEDVLPRMESREDSTKSSDTAKNTKESKEDSTKSLDTAKNTENSCSAESSHVVDYFVTPPTHEHTSLATLNQVTNEESIESAAMQPVVRILQKKSNELDKVSSHVNTNPPSQDKITENQNVLEKPENEVEQSVSLDGNNISINDAERSASEMNSSMSSVKNLKVVVKREIFTQEFSQYDEDVQIIDIPPSEAMVIEDEETAPELLEMLLPRTLQPPQYVPMTIIHNYCASTSTYLDNFPPAQQLPSNFDQSQNQSIYNQPNKYPVIADPARCHTINDTDEEKPNMALLSGLETSSDSLKGTSNKNRENQSKPRNREDSNSNESRQLPGDISNTAYVSIAPQNIPSEIELTQTALSTSAILPKHKNDHDEKELKTSSDSLKGTSNKNRENESKARGREDSNSNESRQLPGDISNTGYVSIAPQNIPSEIELTQTDLSRSVTLLSNKNEQDEQNSNNKDKRRNSEKPTDVNTQDSGSSMDVCVSECFGETKNISSPTFDQVHSNSKTEECLVLDSNKQPESSELGDDVESNTVNSDISENNFLDASCKNVAHPQSLIKTDLIDPELIIEKEFGNISTIEVDLEDSEVCQGVLQENTANYTDVYSIDDSDDIESVEASERDPTEVTQSSRNSLQEKESVVSLLTINNVLSVSKVNAAETLNEHVSDSNKIEMFPTSAATSDISLSVQHFPCKIVARTELNENETDRNELSSNDCAKCGDNSEKKLSTQSKKNVQHVVELESNTNQMSVSQSSKCDYSVNAQSTPTKIGNSSTTEGTANVNEQRTPSEPISNSKTSNKERNLAEPICTSENVEVHAESHTSVAEHKNASKDETSSQSFTISIETTSVPIITSTQLECSVEVKQEPSNDCSIEFIHLSYCASSSDCPEDNDASDEKFSETSEFKTLSVSKNLPTDKSQSEESNIENLLDNVNSVQKLKSREIPKHSEHVARGPSLESLPPSMPSIGGNEKVTNFNDIKSRSAGKINIIPEEVLVQRTKQKPICEQDKVGESIESIRYDSKLVPQNILEVLHHTEDINKTLTMHDVQELSLNIMSSDILMNLSRGTYNESDDNNQLNVNTQLIEEFIPDVENFYFKENMTDKLRTYERIHKRRRTMSEQEFKHNPVEKTNLPLSLSEPVDVLPNQQSIQFSEEKLENRSEGESKSLSKNSSELRNMKIPGFIPIAAIQNKISSSDQEFIEVPLFIDKSLASSLVFPTTESNTKNTLMIQVKLKLENQAVSVKYPFKMSRDEMKRSKTQILVEQKQRMHPENIPKHTKSPRKPSSQLAFKSISKIAQPCEPKNKTTPKKSSKLPDYVPQKKHAFLPLPNVPCKKTCKSKPPSLLTVEECDYLIEDASQLMSTKTASQILGTDCTYFENSEFFRNLDKACTSHHPHVPDLGVEDLPEQLMASPKPVSSSQPSSSIPPSTVTKVIHLQPIILSEGVTARKVWQVNLQWKNRHSMSMDVRFSFNKRSMAACDESAKLLFNYPSTIWFDVHRILKEIDHFEYRRRSSKNPRRTTPLHKVLRQLFDSSPQIIDVKLIEDGYNPFAVCEKNIPVYRKPFQCLTRGISADILSKMKYLKENIQDNNETITYPGRL